MEGHRGQPQSRSHNRLLLTLSLLYIGLWLLWCRCGGVLTSDHEARNSRAHRFVGLTTSWIAFKMDAENVQVSG